MVVQRFCSRTKPPEQLRLKQYKMKEPRCPNDYIGDDAILLQAEGKVKGKVQRQGPTACCGIRIQSIHCNFMLTGLKFKVSSGIYKKYKMLVTPFFNVTGIVVMHLATVQCTPVQQ
jgi:hypothetical protein